MAQCSPNATNGSPRGVVARCSPNATQGLTPDAEARNSPTPQKAHPILPSAHHKRRSVVHYGTLEGGHRTRTRLGLTPQLNWRLPTIKPQQATMPQKANNATKGYKTTKGQQDHKRSTIQPHNRLGFQGTQEKQAHKLELAESPRRTQTYAPNARASPSPLNSNKATKAIGE